MPKAAIAPSQQVRVGPPSREDGPAVNRLIARCPPLDRNSTYCNVLQCWHFAATSAIARLDDEVVGFVAGYRPPQHADALFVWQVAVDEGARGAGLAHRMILDVVRRPASNRVRQILTTVTASNKASHRMFSSLAHQLGTFMRRLDTLDGEQELGGAASEDLFLIGPFAPLPAN